MQKKAFLFLLLTILSFSSLTAQNSGKSTTTGKGKEIFDNALSFFSKNDYRNALVLFRKVVANPSYSALAPDAYYWSVLSDLALKDYDAAGKDIDYFLANYRNNARYPDVVYQNGRLEFLKDNFEKSLRIFQSFISAYPRHDMYPAALFWAGECMYQLGQFADAEKTFSVLIEKYPESVKRDTAEYRLDLIEQKYREIELLKLLKWSHEESLKSIEEFQRREKSYEQAINAFQRKIADMLKDTRQAELEQRIADLEKQNADMTQKLNEKDLTIAALTQQLQALSPGAVVPAVSAAPTTSADDRERLLSMKNEALELKDFYIEWLAKNGGSK
jgi:TolA-binding protein